MSVLRFCFVLMIFVMLLSEFYVTAALGEVSQNEAASALTDAEGAVGSAYRAVLQAEQAGANVSSLLDQLNSAGQNLTLANLAYRQGDFQKAADFANASKNTGEEVQNAAVVLRGYALNENVQRLWLTMAGSIVGIAVVSVGSFLVWRVFERRYHERVLALKPEVSSDES